MTLRGRLSALLHSPDIPTPAAPSLERAGHLRVLPSPLDALKPESRDRLKECAAMLDVTEGAALHLAVRELWVRIRAEEADL